MSLHGDVDRRASQLQQQIIFHHHLVSHCEKKRDKTIRPNASHGRHLKSQFDCLPSLFSSMPWNDSLFVFLLLFFFLRKFPPHSHDMQRARCSSLVKDRHIKIHRGLIICFFSYFFFLFQICFLCWARFNENHLYFADLDSSERHRRTQSAISGETSFQSLARFMLLCRWRRCCEDAHWIGQYRKKKQCKTKIER